MAKDDRGDSGRSGGAGANLAIVPVVSTNISVAKTVNVALSANPSYVVGTPDRATITIAGNSGPITSIRRTAARPRSLGQAWPERSIKCFSKQPGRPDLERLEHQFDGDKFCDFLGRPHGWSQPPTLL